MKIGQSSDKSIPISLNTPAPQKGAQSASAAATATAAKSTQSAGVAVTVSTLARTLEAAKPGESSEIDSAKVSAVRSAIKQGTYVVNPEAIADKLLSNAQEMLARARH